MLLAVIESKGNKSDEMSIVLCSYFSALYIKKEIKKNIFNVIYWYKKSD